MGSLQETVKEGDVNDSEESHIGDAIRCFLEYIKRNHGDETRAALREIGLTPKPMNEYEIAATIHHTKIGITQWRSFVQCVREFTGLERKSFCVTEREWRELGGDHGEVKAGKWDYHPKKKNSKKSREPR